MPKREPSKYLPCLCDIVGEYVGVDEQELTCHSKRPRRRAGFGTRRMHSYETRY